MDTQDLRTQLTQVEKRIADLEAMRGILSEKQRQEALAPLAERKAELKAQLSSVTHIDTGGGDYIGRDKTVYGDDVQGDKIEGDNVQGNKISVTGGGSADVIITGDNNQVFIIEKVAHDFWQKSPETKTNEPDLTQATTRYLQYLVDRYQYLDLKGMGISDQMPLRLPLRDLYVPQHVQAETDSSNRKNTRDTTEQPDKLLPINLLQKNDGLVVLGHPGSGKTTFLKYLALQLALGEGQALNLADRLPLVVPLTDYAEALAVVNQPLNEFLPKYYRDCGIPLPLQLMIDSALQQGRALILLDGLDQVSGTALRHILMEQITNFYTFYRQKGNKFVITSRIIGYHEVRLTAVRLAECKLLPFDEADIATFLQQWTITIEKRTQGDNDVSLAVAQKVQREMQTALTQNPGVRQLAANPLMLTILALMKRQGFTLAEKRVEVYQQYIDTLLKHWHVARSLGRPPAQTLDVIEAQQVFASLARIMVESEPGHNSIDGRTLNKYLQDIFQERGDPDPRKTVPKFLNDIRTHAGLLVEKGPNQFGFIHQTLQEYLTAVAIADLGQQSIDPIFERLNSHLIDNSWHEIILFVIGYIGLIQRRPEASSALLFALMAQNVSEVDLEPGSLLMLASQAAADIWPGGMTVDCHQTMVTSLQKAIEDNASISAMTRIHLGQALARLGDPRPEVLSLDEMRFAFVPASPFWMGSGTHEHWSEEITESFWLGKYPVTNAQYAEFVAALGYQEKRYWTEARAVGRWQDGRVKGFASAEWREKPRAYGMPFDLPNHPVVGLAFFEAIAFTRWLTEHWQAQGILPSNWRVQLPSEAEWELAARGGQQIPVTPFIANVANLPELDSLQLRDNPQPHRLFPWETGSVSPYANFREAGANSTNCVGIFKRGRSVTGCEEMSGNVWEWTRSHFADYPYRAKDGRETSAVKLYQHIALRGGAYWSTARDIHCTARVRRNPNDANSSYGFRIQITKAS